MPVHNPKTGEQDYVDITLVDKVIIDSMFLHDMVSDKSARISFSLSGDQEEQKVFLKATADEIKITETVEIPLEDFEQMISDAIHHVDSQKLEDTESFRQRMKELISAIIDNAVSKDTYLAEYDETYQLFTGLGIIRDVKTKQEVGTFEKVEVKYQKAHSQVLFHELFLSGRKREDLIEADRYEFAFYDLEKGLIYSFMNDKDRATINNNDFLNVEDFNLLIQPFTEEHNLYQIVQDIQSQKDALAGVSPNHPLYEAKREEYTKSHLALLEKTKQQRKQKELFNQFADIEINF